MTKEPYVEPLNPQNSQIDFLKQLPMIIRDDSNFRRFLVAQTFMGGGGISLGFLAVYAIQTWNLPDSQAGVFTVAMLIGQALSNLIFGWLADRKGHKMVLELSVFSTILSVGIAALAPTSNWFYMVFFLTGISNAGFMLAGIMIIFEFCQPEIRPTYIGFNNTFNGLVAIFMPFWGGWLASVYGYRTMFWVALIVCSVGYTLLRFWVREPRLMQTPG
jgi:MFS family permease